MSVVFKQIVVRTSRGEGDSNQAPLDVRDFAQDLDEALPRFLFYPDSADADTVHVLLLQAVMQKAANVDSTFILSVDAGTGLKVAHEIDAGDPGSWNPLGGATRGVLYPIVGNAGTFYVGFSVA